MFITVVVNMKNSNALIAMAQVAQNANNPYMTFCEYIRYCIVANTSDTMTLTEMREALGREFGLFMPYNVLLSCLSHMQETGTISYDTHQIKRIQGFDTDAFDRARETYRNTEFAVIQSLIQYVSKYHKDWSFEYARELLIKVLDRNGLAYDIFLYEKSTAVEISHPAIAEGDAGDLLPDDEEIETSETDDQPFYSDIFFVGKFVEDILAGDSVQKDYLKKICEGLMLCVGTYQLPTADAPAASSQIMGTKFFFDTKLLLRFVGCAGEAAVEAAKELVSLIQNAGGAIYYYPQTFEEMDRALDKAARSLESNDIPFDDEMRLYAARIKYNAAVITAKQASLKSELADANIYLCPHDTFSDNDRIRFGFDYDDIKQYMRNNLPWDPLVTDNDSLAIWETHMRRQGNYSEYCGTIDKLPIFVTTNSRLINVALKFRNDRANINSIHGWRSNRLPVITDIRLTCRLWSPAADSERMALLYLTANAVAAKQPTKRYIKGIRELAIQLGELTPGYSSLCLPAYFDDHVTDAILETTLGSDDKFNIGNFASSIAELAEWKAKEQEEKTDLAIKERNRFSRDLEQQTHSIIEGAVEDNKDHLGWIGVVLFLVLQWPAIMTVLFAGVSSLLSWMMGNWNICWITLAPAGIKAIEMRLSSNFIVKRILKWIFPRAECWLEKWITRHLHRSEIPYKDEIIQQVKEQNMLWVKCSDIFNR